jgi:hypothetical protein
MQLSLDLPKVLAVDINAWRDSSGRNTISGFFKTWDKEKIAQIYTRSVLPDTIICDNFFRISENAVMRSIYSRGTATGMSVKNNSNPEEADRKAAEGEARLYKKASSKHSWLMSFFREIVWTLGKWKTGALDNFIEDFNPDILFFPIFPNVYMGVIQYYILNKTKKPAVCYLSDDNYSYKTGGINPLFYLHRFFLRKVIRKVVDNCEKMLVIAPKQKEEYDKVFGVDSMVITKGIDFTGVDFTEKPVNSPIKMVYTGKLIIGRWKSLAAIAEALGEINKDAEKMILDIYTTDDLSPAVLKKLNRNGCAVKGAVPAGEVAGIQANADIVVFVESLDWRFKNAARLSFSTKLTDYFKSGKCIFAVGDENIAPIDYLIKNDCAVAATRCDDIEKQLKMLVENPKKIIEYGRKAFECGQSNHNMIDIDSKFKNMLKELCANER